MESGGPAVGRQTVNRGGGGSVPPVAVSKLRQFRSPHICLCLSEETLKAGGDPNQYGSIKKSSTTHALVDLLHQCYTSTDASRQYARIILLDFSKAFDLINHNILLQKVASFGLPNILMKWIVSFLTERTQQVKLCNTQSDWNYIHGGVPQGTKLGPVLFVLMINDLQTKCDSYKYVDDTCIIYTGSDS